MRMRVAKVTVGLFFLLLLLGGVLLVALPERTFSETENRSLTTLPRFTLRRLWSGEYSDGIHRYFADQFPFRDVLVELKATCELVAGRGENDGILLGDNNTLARRRFSMLRAEGECGAANDHYDETLLALSAEGVLRAERALNVPLSVAFTGRSIDVNADAFSYPDIYSRELLSSLRVHLQACESYVDVVTPLRSRAAEGEGVYYRTDHHWTSLGAYYAYAELMRAWGMEADLLPREAFSVETVEGFYGTAHAAAGWRFVPPDTLELWHVDNEDAFTVTVDGRRTEGFFSRAYLATRDKYAVYLDGVHECTIIEKEGEERERLVIFKDSFANSIAPFLAQHFDLVLLNLSSTRNDYTDLSRYASEYGADRVLVLYTLENVMTTDTVARFR